MGEIPRPAKFSVTEELKMDRRRHLIRQLDESRRNLAQAERATQEHTRVTEEWRMHELLAHVAVWDEVSAAALRRLALTDQPPVSEVLNIDDYNAQIAAECAELDYRQIVRRWQQARELLKETIGQLPLEQLDVRFVYPWGSQGTAAEMIQILAHHEQEHADEINELRVGE